jgi:hypothetical protein
MDENSYHNIWQLEDAEEARKLRAGAGDRGDMHARRSFLRRNGPIAALFILMLGIGAVALAAILEMLEAFR